MLSYDEAFTRIIAGIAPLPGEECPIADSAGRALAADVRASAPIPPFRNSSMDGFALRFADLAAGNPLHIAETVRAGVAPAHAISTGEAASIMTGAMVPDGADTVVPIEDCVVDGGLLKVTGSVESGQCIRLAGEDVAEGTIVASAGTSIGPGAVGMFAAVGLTTVMAHRWPRVAIVTTGDELVLPGSPLLPGQIYNSNGFSLAAQVEDAGGIVVGMTHAGDSPDALRQTLDALKPLAVDILITSGGVSVGGYDYVKEIVAERGSLDFWRVAIRPGKPVAYGTCQGSVYFGLPGNPVSTMVTFELFVRPSIRRMMGHSVIERPRISARLLEAIRHQAGRRSFVRAVVARTNETANEFVATLSGRQESGMLHAMIRANSLLIVPEERDYLEVGETVQAIVIDPATL